MRLLHTKSLEMQVFMPSSVPDYVILSHRWNTQSTEECSLEDMTKLHISDPQCPARKKQGFSKIQGACNLALRDGYSWIWIDSCCIDKSSSAELQEAINSMWKYYEESNICYVYMTDIQDFAAGWGQSFCKSDWFTRGWTLQELIAPVCVEFYAKDWAMIGTKNERHEEIADITKIDKSVLVWTQDIQRFSAAEKLSWVAHRGVTREEDEAYSLLGLFEVNMPLLYGEGRQRAFVRLQEAIFNSTADHTLFLFRHSLYQTDQPLFADSPTRFCDRIDCILCRSSGLQTVQCLPPPISYANIIASDMFKTQAHEQIQTTVTPFRNEMSTTLPLLRYEDVSDKLILFEDIESEENLTHVAILNHVLMRPTKGVLCLLLRRGRGLAIFHRVRAFPAILPHLGEFTSKLQKTKILICPRANNLPQNKCVDTTFSVAAGPFLAQEWSATGDLGNTILQAGGGTKELQVQTSVSGTSRHSVQISCRIADDQNCTLMISLHLIRTDTAWSIKEVSEVEEGMGQRQQQALFRSSHLVHRCSLAVSGGKTVSVALRRLPAACRSGVQGSASEYRYQIIVGYLLKEGLGDRQRLLPDRHR